jgi:hypothetical protein
VNINNSLEYAMQTKARTFKSASCNLKLNQKERIMSRRQMRKQWLAHDGKVEDVRRTGEERYSHPSIERPITVNKRRKDATRKLESALRRIKKG